MSPSLKSLAFAVSRIGLLSYGASAIRLAEKPVRKPGMGKSKWHRRMVESGRKPE